MPSEWRNTTLGALLSFANGKTSPERDEHGKYEVFGSNGSIGRANTTNSPGNTIIVGRVGSYCGSLHYSSGSCWVTDNAIRATAIDGNDPRFLLYLLQTLNLNNWRSGSGQPLLNQSILSSIPTAVPGVLEQREIASALGALDDKIARLRETNATLEAIAQAVFKSWFVDFDPIQAKVEGRDPEGVPPEVADLFPSEFQDSVLGEIPKGWLIEPLGNWLTVLETGRRPKGGVSGIQSGVPSIGAENVTRVGQYDFAKTKYVTEDFFAQMRSGVLQSHDVLLYKDGGKPGIFLPRVSMFGDGFPFEVCGINEHVFRMRIKEPLGQVYLYFWLWSDAVMHELKHRGGKAAIPGINQSDVKEQKLLIPNRQVALAFNETAEPLFLKLLNNAKEIQSLAALRDTLLPRLMSGKLRIPEIQEAVEEAPV